MVKKRLFIFFIFAIGAEILIHYVGTQPFTPLFNASYFVSLESNRWYREFAILDPLYGLRFLPGQQFNDFVTNSRGPGDGIGVRTDSQGFVQSHGSSSDFRVWKESNKFKILISGSSAAMGMSLKEGEKTWYTLLSEKIQLTLQKGRRVVLVNSSFFPQNIVSAQRKFAYETSYLEPDLVIHLDADYHDGLGSGNPIDFADSRGGLRVRELINRSVRPALFFPNLIWTLETFLGKIRSVPDLYFYRGDQYINRRHVEMWDTRVRLFNESALQKKADFLYVLGPILGSCTEGFVESHLSQYPTKGWKELTQRAGEVATLKRQRLSEKWQVDASCIFKRIEKSIYLDPVHFNQRGQTALAELIFSKVLELNYVAPAR